MRISQLVQAMDEPATEDLRAVKLMPFLLRALGKPRSGTLRSAIGELRAWARDSLVLSLPDQILCRPDCAGLCGECGKNLNDEPHTHEEEHVDPRWAALEELRERQ